MPTMGGDEIAGIGWGSKEISSKLIPIHLKFLQPGGMGGVLRVRVRHCGGHGPLFGAEFSG